MLALQVLHINLSVVVMLHCTENQLRTIMWFIIFQARAHYFAQPKNDFSSFSISLHYLQCDVRSFTKLLYLLCYLIQSHKKCSYCTVNKTDKLKVCDMFQERQTRVRLIQNTSPPMHPYCVSGRFSVLISN